MDFLHEHKGWTKPGRCTGAQPQAPRPSAYPCWHMRLSRFGAELPQIGALETGKPYFMDRPGWHFSVSHSRTHVLCALSEFPVGVDVETRREMSPAHILRLTRGFDPGELDVFELWVLRESLYKLTGRGDLRSMPFSMKEGVIYPPVPDVSCRLTKISRLRRGIMLLTGFPKIKLFRRVSYAKKRSLYGK